ncbi:MAG: metallophosphoesterase [Roseateles sp.]|jgi:hypothetical protein|nr:metallophosphoesterase [Burkholderiaceae bacterium]MCH8181518.1 metallophosphoesterase [Pseudomonadota bacterium]
MAKPKTATHRYGVPRPSADGQFNSHVRTPQEVRDTHFRPLPPPLCGNKAPFQMDLASIIPAADIKAITAAKKITFHVNGDVGGIANPDPQLRVAEGMEADFVSGAKAPDNPAFLYILGDCVYFNGSIDQYRTQFYEPYKHYLAPIVAVPGNHDGENVPPGNTLDGFMKFFCDCKPQIFPELMGDNGRTTMTQPYVFWTLRTPLVNIVGLYSNVPEGGDIREPQLSWLTDQLKTLPKGLPLLVTLHHPIYSADVFHSGSTHMKDLLESAAQRAGRHPDMVLAGHVHMYERFTKTLAGGGVIPYLVAGAGGYHNLHKTVKVDGQKLQTPTQFVDKEGETVVLEKYCDDRWGFLRLEVTDSLITGRYFTVPNANEPSSLPSELLDYFEFDWRHHRLLPNTLKSPKPGRKAGGKAG